MGGIVEDGEGGKTRYDGRSRKFMLVREGMGVEELRGLVCSLEAMVQSKV